MTDILAPNIRRPDGAVLMWYLSPSLQKRGKNWMLSAATDPAEILRALADRLDKDGV